MKNWDWKTAWNTFLDIKHWNDKHKVYAASTVFVILVVIAAASPKTLMASSHGPIATPSDAQTTEAATEAATEAPTEAVTEAEPVVEKDSAVRLNKAYVYPEGADQSDVWNSYAGSLYKDMTSKDAKWLSELYSMSSVSPAQMASRLGKKQSSVLGKYRSDVESHKENEPGTWTIPKFERITYTFVNGNGDTITACSNAKEIMTMASIYTYYKDDPQGDLMRQYANSLWEQSHSSRISMGKVYYCKGELDSPIDESEEPEEAAVYLESTAAETTTAPETTPAATAAETQPASPSNATETYPEEIEQLLEGVTGPGRQVLASEAMSQAEESVVASAAAETTPAAKSSTAAESTTAEETTAARKRSEKGCLGHVDLYVTAVIAGFDGEKGLYAKDSTGNAADETWHGWEEYNKAYAGYLYNLDWLDTYGLAASDIAVINPLTASEIAHHMKDLPSNLSQTRRNVIEFALSSVGRVPYYWGGKPASSNYDGNSFGSLVQPDRKGRVLRGLDCSGWINWVYWSVTGNRLPAEGTGSLSTYAKGIRKEDMQPGDIMVKISANSHVVMFLGWESPGVMKCIHESSAGSGNVTISTMDANGTTYRSLVSP